MNNSSLINFKDLNYKRLLIKISGEVLMGSLEFGHDIKQIDDICQEIAEVRDMGIEISLVVGGGNIYRGVSASAKGMTRASADYIGMLATVMNALALQNSLEKMGVDTRVMSAITMTSIAEPYIRRKAIRHLEKGRVVIFAGGTGNPFFTTDSAAALRANEMGCDALLKGTKVDGVYTKDPSKYSDAVKYNHITYDEVFTNDIQVMDLASVALCRDNKLPIIVFSIKEKGNLKKIMDGNGSFTIIKN